VVIFICMSFVNAAHNEGCSALTTRMYLQQAAALLVHEQVHTRYATAQHLQQACLRRAAS
jgi:hypothetical protein